MTPQGSPTGAADPIVERARRVAEPEGFIDANASARAFARWIVRWSDTVAAAVRQEEAATAFAGAQERSRLVALRSFREEDEAAEAEGLAESAWSSSTNATEQAVRAALPRDEKEGG